MRTAIPQRAKKFAELLTLTRNICPFCGMDDFNTFEFHHINGDSSCHELSNLILVCPSCHTKIEKKFISLSDVQLIKLRMINHSFGVDFISAVVDPCSGWVEHKKNCFFSDNIQPEPHPVIGFTIINHLPRTMVLHRIKLNITPLPHGLSGIPQATVLKSLIKYRLCIRSLQGNDFPLTDPIQLPAKSAVKFEIELYTLMSDGSEVAIGGRLILHFVFEFDDQFKLTLPDLFLNCTDAKEPLTIKRNVG